VEKNWLKNFRFHQRQAGARKLTAAFDVTQVLSEANTVLKLIPNSQAFLQANNLPNLGTIFLMYAPTVYIMWRFDKGFAGVDERFDKVDERMDERFDKVDERFDKVDERFAKVDERMDERFDKVDERFAKVDERFDKVDGQANHLLQGLNNLTADVGELKGKVEILTRLFPNHPSHQ